MQDEKTVQRFIELRAGGWTYARLMAELTVSKPTLIAWSRKFQYQIQNLKAIEMEALRERWLNSTATRVTAAARWVGPTARDVPYPAPAETAIAASTHPARRTRLRRLDVDDSS